jgi:hypothetical protein
MVVMETYGAVDKMHLEMYEQLWIKKPSGEQTSIDLDSAFKEGLLTCDDALTCFFKSM